MRRIAAVFASKRSDRSDAASSTAASSSSPDHSLPAQKQASVKPRARFFRSISRKSKPVDPVVNRLNSSELHPPSSSSSSSGAPTTPDDDRGSLLRVPASKAWLPLPPLPVDHHSSSSSLLHHPELTPHDRSSFHSTPRPRAAPSRQSTLDTEDDSSEESSAPDLSRPPERATPLAAPAYVLALTSSRIRPPFAPPPLLHVPGSPTFPRSCNPRRTLPYVDSLESNMHRARLQRHLQRGDLTPSEQRSIASFAGRRSAPRERLSLQLDDNAVDPKHVRPFSAGLRRWADRPCFEDRLQVLLAEDAPSSSGGGSDLAWTRVAPATGYGVAALEYSVALEMLAGLYEEDTPRPEEPQGSEPDPAPLDFLRLDTQLSLDLSLPLAQSPMTPSPSSLMEPQSSTSSLSLAAPASAPAAVSSLSPPSNSHSTSRNNNSNHYKAHPSPLRMEASSSPPATNPISSPAPSTSSTAVASPRPPSTIASPPASAPAAPLKSALKQGVRFAEGEKDDKEDGVPLGYVQRIKQKREEKARFLQQERERRKHDDERRRHEEEKRRWEEERAAWEREKRAIEEERKKRMYADEIAAARSRRESQRLGALSGLSGEGLATGQWDRNERGARSEREVSATHARPTYDSAGGPSRQGSEASVHQVRSPRANGSSASPSPSGSRPGSVYSPTNVPGSSRPSSMYSGSPVASSSQQDVRLRERRISGTGSRRASMASESGGMHKPVALPPMPMQPMWGMPMNMNGAPMQGMPMGMAMPMPMYGGGMDMPLLPPSPPFMMGQYHRPNSQNSNRNSQYSTQQRSHSSSPTLGRQSLPASHSSERVNRMSQALGSSASARAPSVPRSETTPRRGHHRTSSGEVMQRPNTIRSHSDDKRSTKSSATASQRPMPVHSSSLPPHPPPSFNNAPRQSWALPKSGSGFENVSRPSQGTQRQTVIS